MNNTAPSVLDRLVKYFRPWVRLVWFLDLIVLLLLAVIFIDQHFAFMPVWLKITCDLASLYFAFHWFGREWSVRYVWYRRKRHKTP